MKTKTIERKIEKLMQKEQKLLHCDTAVIFNDTHLALPVSTNDGQVIEAAYCPGYEQKKYIIALSNQTSCVVGCKFCEINNYSGFRNLSPDEVAEEISIVVQEAAKKGFDVGKIPLKMSFVKVGDALMNKQFGSILERAADELPVSMKISSTYPDTASSHYVFGDIAKFAGSYDETIQMQISIHSTDEQYRQNLVRMPLSNFCKISDAGEKWKEEAPNQRKINLTFTVNNDTPLEPSSIVRILPPSLFAIRLRNWIPTDYGSGNGITTPKSSKMESSEAKFRDFGYEIIPGKPGETETENLLSGGRIIRFYNHMRR